jgi:hypothetical protein
MIIVPIVLIGILTIYVVHEFRQVNERLDKMDGRIDNEVDEADNKWRTKDDKLGKKVKYKEQL